MGAGALCAWPQPPHTDRTSLLAHTGTDTLWAHLGVGNLDLRTF